MTTYHGLSAHTAAECEQLIKGELLTPTAYIKVRPELLGRRLALEKDRNVEPTGGG